MKNRVKRALETDSRSRCLLAVQQRGGRREVEKGKQTGGKRVPKDRAILVKQEALG